MVHFPTQLPALSLRLSRYWCGRSTRNFIWHHTFHISATSSAWLKCSKTGSVTDAKHLLFIQYSPLPASWILKSCIILWHVCTWLQTLIGHKVCQECQVTIEMHFNLTNTGWRRKKLNNHQPWRQKPLIKWPIACCRWSRDFCNFMKLSIWPGLFYMGVKFGLSH
jgi:hypothetical protein